MAALVQVVSAEVLAIDTVRVVFSEAMVPSGNILVATSYTVDSTEGVPSMVVDVLSGAGSSLTEVLLVLTQPTEGAEYTVSVLDTLEAASGDTMDPANASTIFTAKSTKMDSYLDKLPKLYTRRHDSNLRLVMQAIMREDELIGGKS